MEFPREALSSAWHGSLRKISSPSVPIKDLLGTCVVNRVQISSSSVFGFEVHPSEDVDRCIACEVLRFLCASSETFAQKSRNGFYNNSAAWTVVQVYYSAFYAAHALLRICGRIVSRLESKDFIAIFPGKVNSRPVPKKGLYELRYQYAKSRFECTFLDEAHAGLWSSFNNLLNEVVSNVPNVSATERRKREIIEFILVLQQSLTNDGRFEGGNWLSFIRNEVNYRFEFSTWSTIGRSRKYPYNDALRFLAGASKGPFELDPGLRDLDRFFQTAACVMWLTIRSAQSLLDSKTVKCHFLEDPRIFASFAT
jgi:hypothetical protein